MLSGLLLSSTFVHTVIGGCEQELALSSPVKPNVKSYAEYWIYAAYKRNIYIFPKLQMLYNKCIRYGSVVRQFNYFPIFRFTKSWSLVGSSFNLSGATGGIGITTGSAASVFGSDLPVKWYIRTCAEFGDRKLRTSVGFTWATLLSLNLNQLSCWSRAII